MSFRTEMGFYYSYYKTVIEEKQFLAGIARLMYDKLVEFPKDVNALNRFNIAPEVMIAAMYRYLEPWLNSSEYKECHMVERGEDYSSVESCVGLGEPVYFYLEVIWWMAGFTVAVLFLQATVLSQSILGGVFAVVQYFANHAESTRVQWAPNERENFAAPLLIAQTWLLSMQLREKNRNTVLQLQVSIFVINVLCLLFWQFTQFIFLTQTAIFFMMEQLRIIDIKSLSIFLHLHFCSLHTAILLLQGNDMLKSSLYASFFLVVSIYCLFFSSLRIKVQNRLDLYVETWLVMLRVSLVVLGSFYFKKLISESLQLEEDSHVWDILYSKFSDYKNFHTMLYTCSEVFDFLPFSSVINMTTTLLIPTVIAATCVIICHWLSEAMNKYRKDLEEVSKSTKNAKIEDEDSGIENNTDVVKKKDLDVIIKKINTKIDTREAGASGIVLYLRNLKIDPAIFYNLSQMAVYGVMAALVMRLKLLFSTQMCIFSSLIANRDYYPISRKYKNYIPFLYAVMMIPVLVQLRTNIDKELANIGEFSDYPQEELLSWISREAGAGSFAGSMPILSAVMLSTRRPVVAHPHYEHKHARQRAYSVYKLYGRFPPSELYQELNKLRATYLIVEDKYCYGKSNRGCSFKSIWDTEAPHLSSRPSLCHTLLTQPVEHFYRVFRNTHYAVFRIHDFEVRYMPRSFDT
ncbi:unnamed protein product [Danaus chrysippus]|uniref:(African queen) hypothetical protein n=1 Tax=Danaus chrysippus TaxID=151541 RepID=A0A8J2R892_9NEOP|nr:unnamed protein product [Danaus chrysippus]